MPKTIHEFVARVFFLKKKKNKVTSLPLYEKPKLTRGHSLGLSLASWEDKGYVDLPSQSTASRPLQCGFSGERHYLHELRKQIKIHKLYVVMIFERLKWPLFDLTQLERVHANASSKKNKEIRKVGLSETHASGNREASTHND